MAGNIFQDVHTAEGYEAGKEGGSAVLADKADFLSCIVAEYVWLDSKGQTRSKCKTVDKKPENADDCAIWSFNGAETGQSELDNSDVYLVPRKVFDDPVRGAPHILVVCEAISPSMEPAMGNFRAECSELAEKYGPHDFWFGFEQEYVCCDEDGNPLQTYKGKEGGDFYCGRGALHLAPKMRELMGDHYAMCLRGGIKISGMNVEQGMAQGEFQIGPCKGINIGDHMVAARHTLHKAANKYRVAISFKAINDGVNGGSGMHANISTKQTRGEGGLAVIEKCARALGKKAKEGMQCYGEGNAERMSGKFNTPDMGTFRFGVADRTASIRVPRGVGIVGKGYLEDRRPAANADPYRVAQHLFRTLGEVMNNPNKQI